MLHTKEVSYEFYIIYTSLRTISIKKKNKINVSKHLINASRTTLFEHIGIIFRLKGNFF